MLTLDLKTKKLSTIFNRIHSSSNLEEMLSLMLEDKNVGKMSITANQLFKETVGNECYAPSTLSIEAWVLTDEEMFEFFSKFREVLGVEQKQDFSEELSITINFEDASITLMHEPFGMVTVINCNKVYLRENEDMADLIRQALRQRPVELDNSVRREANGEVFIELMSMPFVRANSDEPARMTV